MAKLGFSKPTKSQLINAGASVIGAGAGYEAYNQAAQRFPITKEMKLGVAGGATLGYALIKGTGVAALFAKALCLGIAVNSGYEAANDYGIISHKAPQATAKQLQGLLGGEMVEYIPEPETIDMEHVDLSGIADNSDLM